MTPLNRRNNVSVFRREILIVSCFTYKEETVNNRRWSVLVSLDLLARGSEVILIRRTLRNRALCSTGWHRGRMTIGPKELITNPNKRGGRGTSLPTT